MSRSSTCIIALAALLACGSSAVAPASQVPAPAGTFVLDRSSQDSASESVGFPVATGRVCATLSNTLRFFGADSVVETRRYVSSDGTVIVATDVDSGVVARVGASTFALTYPRRPWQSRYDTASAVASGGAVVQLSMTEHFLSNSLCVTSRILLPYRRQGT